MNAAPKDAQEQDVPPSFRHPSDRRKRKLFTDEAAVPGAGRRGDQEGAHRPDGRRGPGREPRRRQERAVERLADLALGWGGRPVNTVPLR